MFCDDIYDDAFTLTSERPVDVRVKRHHVEREMDGPSSTTHPRVVIDEQVFAKGTAAVAVKKRPRQHRVAWGIPNRAVPQVDNTTQAAIAHQEGVRGDV